ncbi:MAG: hypothetical protein WC554_01820 [Clostridia bacterium]
MKIFKGAITPTKNQAVRILNKHRQLYNNIDDCFDELRKDFKKKEYIDVLETFIKYALSGKEDIKYEGFGN